MTRRRCSKPSCNGAAYSTLTYVYADSTAVLGPLATYAEPHCYDLCQMHAERLTAPLGWEVVRITPDPDSLKPSSDDLEALANAVREAARPRYSSEDREAPHTGSVEVARKGHLRVLQSAPEPVLDDPFGDYDNDVSDAQYEESDARRDPDLPAPAVHRDELIREPFEDDLLFDD